MVQSFKNAHKVSELYSFRKVNDLYWILYTRIYTVLYHVDDQLDLLELSDGFHETFPCLDDFVHIQAVS